MKVELFDDRGIDFMGPFIPFHQNLYILLAVIYVSKWVEIASFPTNNTNVLLKFQKKYIFIRFGTPMAIISDEGKNFCNCQFDVLLQKYGIKHKVATTYHPKRMAKLKFSIGILREFWRKLFSPSRWIGLYVQIMLYGRIGHLIKYPLECLLTCWFLEKFASSQWRSNTMHIGSLES